ncbi:MAG: hypothetical protein KA392_10455 [Candidatus Obscuribacter sp.]|nr:hypothetical protein [Candidatus Obscuribacter sp.]MBP6594498.1 hypothetical protein [Candidatus Obscuribacter sp.]
MAKILKQLIALTTLSLLSQTLSHSQQAQQVDCGEIVKKVDGLVDKNFYSPEIYKNDFVSAKQALLADCSKIEDRQALSVAINNALLSLKSSHCQFVTDEDEVYYFLISLFKSMAGKSGEKIAVPGFVCGGAGFASKQIRYVLNGTPAASKGMQVGDTVLSINGKQDWTYGDIVKNGNQVLDIKVQRGERLLTFVFKPVHSELYPAYVNAMERSLKYIKKDGKTLGYIHVFAGGALSHDALEGLVLGPMIKTDGLILDLRDGYGASDLSDLDIFYRRASDYPIMVSKGHNGKAHTVQYFYDKPLVVLINEGSRSGKEILAYSLKQSKRATLVGTNTAGYVVAGRLFDIDEHAKLYLAVNDITLNGERLEGKGVAPDVVVKNEDHTYEGYQHQLDVAIATLEKQLSQKAADLR